MVSKLSKLLFLCLVAMACNEVLGLDAGKPENGGGGGSAGAAGANGGFAMVPNTGGADIGGERE